MEELDRGKTRAFYRVGATLHADIPAGELHGQVELTTNNPAMPKLCVPLRVIVETQK